jgi:hypothetical protein
MTVMVQGMVLPPTAKLCRYPGRTTVMDPLAGMSLYKFHHYCRNKPHCGEKLEELDNPRIAFCCRG